MKIYIGSDHAGVDLKTCVKERFGGRFEFNDLGTFTSESVDYPDFAHPVAENVLKDNGSFGILICGTGNGMAITANKHAGIAWSSEIGRLVKAHNNANVLVMPARFISYRMAQRIIDTWLETKFEGGRHQRRIDKINL